ncbi:MAG: hypothetical protein WDW38_010383 [Sanguina aurantia]
MYNQFTAATILTPDLAVAAASHLRKPPNGYQLFMEELRTGNSPITNTYIPSTGFAISRAASRRWAALSPEQQQPYSDAAHEAARTWLDQHTHLDSLLRATGHGGLQPLRPATARQNHSASSDYAGLRPLWSLTSAISHQS